MAVKKINASGWPLTRAVVVSRRDPHTTAKMRSHTSTGELKIGWYRAV